MATPHLRDGGLYVIEDLACCYSRRFGPYAGLANPGSIVEYLKELLDVIHGHPDFGGRIGNEISARVRELHCYPQIVFLVRGEPQRAKSMAQDLRTSPAVSPLPSVRSLRARRAFLASRLRTS